MHQIIATDCAEDYQEIGDSPWSGSSNNRRIILHRFQRFLFVAEHKYRFSGPGLPGGFLLC